jgi:hypothetical protein
MTSSPPLIELLYEAQNSKFGVRVETNDPDLLRQKLYAIRRQHPGEFDNLTLAEDRITPKTHLLIVRKPNAEEVSETHPEPPAG